jgi:hypothetical protein
MRVLHGLPVASLALLLCLWASPAIATSYLLCPSADEAITEESPCPTECYSDTLCESNATLCCPTSNCGRQCLAGVTVPHTPPVLACPDADPDTAGTCTEFCSSDSDCVTDGEICCSNGCGHTCVSGTPVTPICRGILESRNGTQPRIGEYVPQCEEDGRFAETQCHSSTGYCWCVRPATGEPVGTAMSRQPQCNSCSHNDQVYYPRDTFPDDCNTCTCFEDGTFACTEIGCGPSPLFFSCPVLEDDAVGICSEECSSDEDCNSDQKCCSNGCGHTCMDRVPLPFIPPPRHCPEEYESAVCDLQECTDSCDDHRQLCCQNSCGSRLCVDGELPQSPCTDTVNGLTGGVLLGQYIPQCNEETGAFNGLQCSSHYCWCVDPRSGEPTTDMRESGHVGELECTRCSVNGEMYDHQEIVETDGCTVSKCVAGEIQEEPDVECGQCKYEDKVYEDGQIVEYYGGCSKKICVEGDVIFRETCDPCAMNGQIYQHGEETERCGLCKCWDGAVMCQRSAEPCDDFDMDDDDEDSSENSSSEEEDDELEVDDLEWWHYFLLGSGTLIAILAVVAIGLIVVMVFVIRNSHFRHSRLKENAEALSFESDTQVLFKSGPPEGESVELKVPVEDEDEPVKA